MNDLSTLTSKIIEFRNKRDWKQFNNPKDCSISLLLEASELLEHFQWKTPEEMTAYVQSHREEIALELADVLYWILLLSHDLQIDLPRALEDKLKVNEQKYPVSKAKGNHKKYTHL